MIIVPGVTVVTVVIVVIVGTVVTVVTRKSCEKKKKTYSQKKKFHPQKIVHNFFLHQKKIKKKCNKKTLKNANLKF